MSKVKCTHRGRVDFFELKKHKDSSWVWIGIIVLGIVILSASAG